MDYFVDTWGQLTGWISSQPLFIQIAAGIGLFVAGLFALAIAGSIITVMLSFFFGD